VYTVAIRAPGFRAHIETGIVVTGNVTTCVNATLQLVDATNRWRWKFPRSATNRRSQSSGARWIKPMGGEATEARISDVKKGNHRLFWVGLRLAW
jgi:hypothetical protein